MHSILVTTDRYLVFSDMTSMLMAMNHLLAVCGNIPNSDLGDAKVALAKDLPPVRIVRVKNRMLHPTAVGKGFVCCCRLSLFMNRENQVFLPLICF